MSQYIRRIRMAVLVFTALLAFGVISMQVFAESGDEFLLDESGNITLVSAHAAKEGLLSLQFSLAVDAPDGAEVSFEFSSSNAAVCEYRYDESTKILNVYMAGIIALFEDGVESIALGKIKVAGNGDSRVAVSVVEDSLKYVYGSDLKTMEGVSLPGEVVLGGAVPTDPQPAETPTPPAETPPPANVPGAEEGQDRPSGGTSEEPADGTAAPKPPAGNSSGGTANGNGNQGGVGTPEPVTPYYPQRTPDPGQESEENTPTEPEVTGTMEPDGSEMTPAMSNSDNQNPEDEKNSNLLLPIVLGGIAVLCIVGFCLVAVAFKRSAKKEEE